MGAWEQDLLPQALLSMVTSDLGPDFLMFPLLPLKKQIFLNYELLTSLHTVKFHVEFSKRICFVDFPTLLHYPPVPSPCLLPCIGFHCPPPFL